MKVKNITLLIASFLLLASSCSHDSLPVYEDVDRIYFQWAVSLSTVSDQTKVNLGYDKPVKSDSVIAVTVNLMGRLSDIDRPISAEIIRSESDAVPGQDVEILPSVIPAGKEKGSLLVKVKNSQKLETTTLTARIRLTPNSFFHVDYAQSVNHGGKSGLEFNVYFDAKAEMPSLWADLEAGVTLEQYFRKYSNKKLDLICEVCGVTREFFMHDPAIEKAIDVLNARIPTEVSFGMIAQVNRYLEAYKLAHDGQPLTDENGEIKMGSSIK